MTNRFFGAFGRKQAPESPAPACAGAKANPVRSAPRVEPEQSSCQSIAALDLSQELLRGLEHFVLCTPDLDTPAFLDRLRRTAAQLTPAAQPEDLESHRKWAADSLSVFGQLQRRYLSEREDELWRLLTLYQEHQKGDGAANKQFHDALRSVHERMGSVVRLTDLRQVRERLEGEIQRATDLLERKSRADDERAAALAAQVRQLEAALVNARYEATRDTMTGVYHRGGFQTQLETALQLPSACALAMVDVDNFKGINDTLGHLVGDDILKIAVQFLGKIARPGDVIGRFGGDEFCLLAPNTQPKRLADRFDRMASQRTINFQFDERLCSVRLSFSVGVAGSVPGDTADSLIQRADSALYDVKRNGKGHARIAAEESARAA